MEREWIVGRHPVLELLRANRRPVYRLLFLTGIEFKGIVLEIHSAAEAAGLQVESVPRRSLDELASNHQGVAAYTARYPYSPLQDLLPESSTSDSHALFLMLDGIQDPQNFGTLLRTAEIVGVRGVVLPHKGGVGVTPAVCSASSGASEHLRITRANTVQAMQQLKREDVWIYGLEGSAAALRYDEIEYAPKAALVVGSEGQGLRRLVSENCDLLVRIPMRGRIGSLNASVAGSIALFKIWEMRKFS
jgi:23S rRNA (guanosine2251-2'-O)-methyltransferase